jgi:hypothetical protein
MRDVVRDGNRSYRTRESLEGSIAVVVGKTWMVRWSLRNPRRCAFAGEDSTDTQTTMATTVRVLGMFLIPCNAKSEREQAQRTISALKPTRSSRPASV